MSSETVRVLLVEDNLGDARLIFEGLEEALPGQFQMTHVKRLSEALEYLWKETCHVILLDLGLPDSHGIDTLVLTRRKPTVPIVVLTGFQDEALGDQALKEGAQDYLVKGQVDCKLLGRSLRYAIARKAVGEALIGQEVALAKAGMLRRSRQRLIASHERLRQDVASELHDGVSCRLLELKGQLEQLANGGSAASERTRLLSSVIDGLSAEIEQHVSVLSRQLYPSRLQDGLAAAFQSFRDQFEHALTVVIELDEELLRPDQADRDFIPQQVRLAAYRIAEEALTNVVEHAQAAKATVRLDVSRSSWLRLTVRDDGRGFDVERPFDGLGIGTMQDYAEAVDGQCSVESEPGTGTVVTAVLPLSPPGEEKPQSSEKGGK